MKALSANTSRSRSIGRLLLCTAAAALAVTTLRRMEFDSPAEAQGEIPLPPPPTEEEPFSHLTIQSIKDLVLDTADSQRLNLGLTRQLLIPLDDALASLRHRAARR